MRVINLIRFLIALYAILALINVFFFTRTNEANYRMVEIFEKQSLISYEDYEDDSERIKNAIANAQRDVMINERITLSSIVLSGIIFVFGGILILHTVKSAMAKERDANELNEIFFTSSPYVMNVWDKNINLVSTSNQALTMFGLKSKDEYINRFNELSPVSQPDGIESAVKAVDLIKKVFETGYCQFEWLHQDLEGNLIPTEITLTRFSRNNEYFVAAFTMDLRNEKKREMAEEENRTKSRFLARMSHEIRTPMNAVIGITEIELRKGNHSEDTREAFLKVRNSSKLLLSIINDILDLSRVESGKIEITPALYHIESLIFDTVQLNHMLIDEKPINFIIKVDERLPSCLIGDELKIKQVVTNILSNAFKYTGEGTVKLEFELSEDSNIEDVDIILVLHVSDTGQGMSQEQIDELFTEFARFNEDENRNIEGTGLGMSIVYALVELMNGEIKVSSNLGRGSIFTIKIPQKNNCHLSLGKEAAEKLENIASTNSFVKDDDDFVLSAMPYGKVLVVDDVDINVYVAEGILTQYEINVDTAFSGKEAIDLIKAGQVYDIIFMDHMMPDMDGIETTREMRKLGYDKPIVALTANAIKGISEIFISNGFDGFVSKPIDIKELNSYLIKYIMR